MKYVVNVHQMLLGSRQHVEGWLTKDLELVPGPPERLSDAAGEFTLEEVAGIVPTLSGDNVVLVNLTVAMVATQMIPLDGG